MSTLSTSVQVLTKNKPYYLKTNLGLMKIRGEPLSATQHSAHWRIEFENLKKVREKFEQCRKPKNTGVLYTLPYPNNVVGDGVIISRSFIISFDGACTL